MSGFSREQFMADIEERARRNQQERRQRTEANGHPHYPVAEHAQKPKPVVQLVKSSDIDLEPTDWLWKYYLAAGKLHILAGAPGSGKTTIAMRLAAIVSTGGKWPDGTKSIPGSVLIWSGEDDPGDTIVPRLAAAGADRDRIYLVGSVSDVDGNRAFDPAQDMEWLEAAIESIDDLKLIIVDPITSAVAGDSHKNSETRRSLQVFVDLAAKKKAAVIGITHLTKGTAGRDPLERLTGSLAFGALPRVVFIAAKDAEADEDQDPKRYFTRAKSNIGPDGGGFEYEVVTGKMPGNERIETSWITFGEPLKGTARTILAAADEVKEPDKSEVGRAKSFLGEFLGRGMRTQADCLAAASMEDISERTLKRAKKELGIVARKDKGRMVGPWFWAFPDDLPPEDGQMRKEEAHPINFGTLRENQSLSGNGIGTLRSVPDFYGEDL